MTVLGRDKITLHFHNRDTGAEFSRTVMGRVITEQVTGQVDPMNGRPVIVNQYRLFMPRTLEIEMGAASIGSVDFGAREGAGGLFAIPVTPIYDGRGRIRHYEGIVRSQR
ncbi:hypothetical protein ACTJJE_05840 [Mycolicibacterium sp. 22603]|uniref:hypothetical protein n=1 Tax=Mycolicibacterium sp. 22603 TaxID=3453950 RepID=UPI003F86EC54